MLPPFSPPPALLNLYYVWLPLAFLGGAIVTLILLHVQRVGKTLFARLKGHYRQWTGVDEEIEFRAHLVIDTKQTLRAAIDSGWWGKGAQAELRVAALRVWELHWPEVTLPGLLSFKEELEVCKERLGAALASDATLLTDLYRLFCTTDDDAAKGNGHGAADSGDRTTCWISMRRTGWRRLCRRLPALDEGTANRVFDEVTHSRVRGLHERIRVLRRGDHLKRGDRWQVEAHARRAAADSSRSSPSSPDKQAARTRAKTQRANEVAKTIWLIDQARAQLEAAQRLPSLRLCDFIDALVRTACALYSSEYDPIARAHTAYAPASDGSAPLEAHPMTTDHVCDAVRQFMERDLKPHASSLLGTTAELRSCLASTPLLRQAMRELAPLHAEMFARFATIPSGEQLEDAEADGRWQGPHIGVGLPRFLALAEMVAPALPRALVVHAFAMCLATPSVVRPPESIDGLGGARRLNQLLPPLAFEESLVRLALLAVRVEGDEWREKQSEVENGAPGSPTMSAESTALERLEATEIPALRHELHVMCDSLLRLRDSQWRWVMLPSGGAALMHSDVQQAAVLRLQAWVRRGLSSST